MQPLRLLVFIASFTVLTAATFAAAASPAGTWLGTLDAGMMKLRLGMIVVEQTPGEFSVVFISLDQGDAKIPSVDPQFTDSELTAPLPMIGGEFVGSLSDDQESISGQWIQAGAKMPLQMRRVDQLPKQRRPQEPKPPFPYDVEEVTFDNDFGGHILAGTITLPRTAPPHAAIVLVTGSGPQDRDETLLGHKPFAVLADAITRRGVAVLRFDDRGVGQSTGDFATATSKDFATDALSAVRYLAGRKEFDSSRIAIGGHSEGAMVASMVAAKFPQETAGIVLLAPSAVTGEEIIITQGRALETKMGMSFADADSMARLRRQAIKSAIEVETEAEFKAGLEEAVDQFVVKLPEGQQREDQRKLFLGALATYRTPWFRYFLAFDAAVPLRKVACPVLVVLGEKDVQVLPEANLEPLKAALEEAPTDDVTIELQPELNHLLQRSTTGLPSEYATIEQTIDPATLELISEWIASKLEVE